MKKMKFKFTLHTYLAIIITVVIFTASVFLYIFMYDTAQTQIANTRDAFIAVADAQGNESKYKELAKTLAATKSDTDSMAQVLVQSDQIITFIESIEKVGIITHASVSILSISADDLSTAATSTTGVARAHIQITGSWQAAMRSLHLVESLPYAISMNNVRVAVNAKKLWTIDFDITTLTIK
jgi:hypothetical protein